MSPKRSTNQVNLIDVPSEDEAQARALVVDMYSTTRLRDDVYCLKRLGGISVRDIAKQIGYDRKELYRWMNGRNVCRNPYVLLMLRNWATEVRRQQN